MWIVFLWSTPCYVTVFPGIAPHFHENPMKFNTFIVILNVFYGKRKRQTTRSRWFQYVNYCLPMPSNSTTMITKQLLLYYSTCVMINKWPWHICEGRTSEFLLLRNAIPTSQTCIPAIRCFRVLGNRVNEVESHLAVLEAKSRSTSPNKQT